MVISHLISLIINFSASRYQRYWKTHETELAYCQMPYEEFISMMDEKCESLSKPPTTEFGD